MTQVFDAEQTSAELEKWIRSSVQQTLKKRGAVVGISGGIDSSVVASLCCRALGAQRVVGIAMPEKDSSPESLTLARRLAQRLNMELAVEDLTPALESLGAYRRRDAAVKRVFPDYRAGQGFKITLQSKPLESNTLNVFQITRVDEQGDETSVRLNYAEYAQIVAASNMKQRLRMTTLYYHAEQRNYAVAGTGNKNEIQLGFFVKYGDGGSDLVPLGHLYKSQIFQLAEYLQIPREIILRKPTTDTYPAEVTQEDFFFRVSFTTLDAIWEKMENGGDAKTIARRLQLSPLQAQRVMDDIRQKHANTRYLRLPPLTFPPPAPEGDDEQRSRAGDQEVKPAR